MERGDIAQAILDRRNELVRQLLATEQGAELASLEEAYRALVGEEPPPLRNLIKLFLAAEEKTPGTKTVNDQSPVTHRHGTDLIVQPPPKAVPVREAARNLMREQPGEWDYDSILRHFKQSDVVLRAENPRDALRTAMFGLVEEGLVEKIGRGRYRTVPKSSAETEGPLPSEG